jgi:hypothetical protein
MCQLKKSIPELLFGNAYKERRGRIPFQGTTIPIPYPVNRSEVWRGTAQMNRAGELGTAGYAKSAFKCGSWSVLTIASDFFQKSLAQGLLYMKILEPLLNNGKRHMLDYI